MTEILDALRIHLPQIEIEEVITERDGPLNHPVALQSPCLGDRLHNQPLHDRPEARRGPHGCRLQGPVHIPEADGKIFIATNFLGCESLENRIANALPIKDAIAFQHRNRSPCCILPDTVFLYLLEKCDVPQSHSTGKYG